jgi:Protein of unknown function (DUF1320)
VAVLLASLDDVKVWLPDDKLQVTDGTISNFQVEAYRIIKSQLAGVFTPVTLITWVSPATTPEIIRGVAGRLIAAYLYREAFTEDSPDIPPYAQKLYDEAIAMLGEIRSGAITVVDPDDIPISDNKRDMNSDDFYPNEDAPGPFFTMTQQFG